MADTLTAAVDVRNLRERPDGSGTVDVPLLVETQILDLRDQGGPLTSVTAEMLREVVSNFTRGRGLIVGVSPSPHRSFGDRAGPQDGFVESLSIRGDQLWGVIDLTAELFATVKARKWRGFSVEMLPSSQIPRVLQAQYNFDGLVLVGGIFTNRPATNTVYRIAAEAVVAAAVFTPLGAKEESRMSDEKTISLSAHDAKVADLNATNASAQDKISRLETQAVTLQAEVATLRAKVPELEGVALAARNDLTIAQATASRAESQLKLSQSKLQTAETAKTELEVKLRELGQRESDARIRKIVADATDPKRDGGFLPVAEFDGYEADPTAWVTANYASLEAFENRTRVALGVGRTVKLSSAQLKSGHDSTLVPDPAKALTDEEQKVLTNLGLDAGFIGVTSEDEARKVYEARKVATK